jgi:hypothetical protein
MNIARRNLLLFNALFAKKLIISQKEYMALEKNMLVVIENAKKNLLYYIVVNVT